MRSGDILAAALQRVAPAVAIGKVLIQRDEDDVNKRAHLFWKKLPANLSSDQVLVLDPMLATGGSALLCLDELVDKHGANSSKMVFVCCIAAPEGIRTVHAKYPSCLIIAGAVDDGLSPQKYILPGLGDAGDRYYGVSAAGAPHAL